VNIGVLIFILCYIGIGIGRLPGLALDRTGVALLGAMFLLATGVLDVAQAVHAIDFTVLILLFGLMLLSAQFRMGGFYSYLAIRAGKSETSPAKFMGLLIAISGGLSSLLSNDVICLVLAPLVIEIAQRRKWQPMPFLLALAAASNVGSAATIIGNPQNMFIGQKAGLHFGRFLLWCLPPTLINLGMLYGWAIFRGRLDVTPDGAQAPPELNAPHTALTLNRYETGKAVTLSVVLVILFLTPIPRELSVLGIASVLMLSRKFTTSQFLGLVDWPLLVLFSGLFVLIEGFRHAGGLEALMGFLQNSGVRLFEPVPFSIISVVLSNLVSNVPAVMLLMADWPAGEDAFAYLLALTSTYAGNLILIGSIANLIVAGQAKKAGIEISFRTHFKWTGLYALFSLVIAVVWWIVACRLFAFA